jgi:hypothetical protein
MIRFLSYNYILVGEKDNYTLDEMLDLVKLTISPIPYDGFFY